MDESNKVPLYFNPKGSCWGIIKWCRGSESKGIYGNGWKKIIKCKIIIFKQSKRSWKPNKWLIRWISKS